MVLVHMIDALASNWQLAHACRTMHCADITHVPATYLNAVSMKSEQVS